MSLAMEALPKNLKNPEKPLIQEAKDKLSYSSQLHGPRALTY
jgi:hypothetical protein